MAHDEGLVGAFIETPETGDFEHLPAARRCTARLMEILPLLFRCSTIFFGGLSSE
jgi:hypothetical protein